MCTNDENQRPSRHPPIFLKRWTVTLKQIVYLNTEYCLEVLLERYISLAFDFKSVNDFFAA